MKAGNDACTLRRTDLALNWALYIGPLAAGASLLSHFAGFGALRTIDLGALADRARRDRRPCRRDRRPRHRRLGRHDPVRRSSPMRAQIRARLSPARAQGGADGLHRRRLDRRLGLRAAVHGLCRSSTCSTPIQYFAIVWLKEGGRIAESLRLAPRGRIAFPIFFALCALLRHRLLRGQFVKLLLAPFIACSLLHFWYDSFVWSVRKKQV